MFPIIFTRPGILLSGLLIFSHLNILSANDIVPINILSRFFLHKPNITPPCTTNEKINIKFSYSPLLKEHRQSDNDRFNSFLEFMNFSGSFLFGNSKLQSRIIYNYDSYCGAVRVDNATYGSLSKQHIHRINSLLWYSVKNMNIGMQLGTIIPITNEIVLKQNQATDYLKSGLLQYGLSTNISFSSFNIQLYADKKPLHFGITRFIKNNQVDCYRNFPMLFTIQSIGTSIKHSTNPIVSQMDISVSKVKNETKISLKMQMPVKLDLNIYRLMYKGKTRDDITWLIDLFAGGGWCSGYSGSFDGMNYFLADSLRINSLHTSFGIENSLRYTLLIEGGALSLRSPNGFLNLAPFSQWTFFIPLSYRFENNKISYFEAGFTTGKLFSINRFYMDLKLSAYFFSTYGKSCLSKKEIVILFPYYNDLGDKKLWNEKGFLFLPKISIPINRSITDFIFTIDGVIPVTFHKKKSGSGQKTKPKPADITGGFKVSLNLSLKKKPN